MQPGDILQQRYQLERCLGQVPGRETWLARDLKQQATVVVKLLMQNPQLQWQDVKLFEREISVLQNLQHPQIPRYRDAFQTEPSQTSNLVWFGLVQDYVPGVNLQKLLEHQGRFTEKQARKIAIDTLKILIDLHELNPPILHRDLKPSNLLLGDDNQIYLIDFGSVQNRVRAEQTTMTIVGTYGYIPLEQFRGKTVAASDLYALGATLLHLLTGIPPSDLPQKQLRFQFADRVTLSPSFRRWLEIMVEPALEHRFKTARQALEALQTGHLKPLKAITQPPGSRVKLYVSGNGLMIKNPAFRASYLAAALTIGAMALMAFMLYNLVIVANEMSVVIMGFVTTLWIVWAIVLLYSFNRYLVSWRCQFIQFTQTHFSIEEQNLGVKYFQRKGKIKDIQTVQQSVQDRQGRSLLLQMGKPEMDVVALKTTQQTYHIGLDLTAPECAWLAQEINDWLTETSLDN
ncbi:serine/threonine protein kinase [Oculatella sp. LEGE 06141]|uniref:serine/threonine protein kinase n=1 Tax=Oculatella sp. LEGE 06141 TaxID=1828648 RepID=UPI00187E75A4|nr:serine/threonine-protein kinase [Oculatella sp. LEGE 06141]MBE9182847.1 serine/threonine protein kinase [Oculatella sp. LEGE 06141]